MDIKQLISERDMSGFQTVTVSLCILGNLVGGFAILILPFTSPAIAESWQLTHEELGTLFSASLLGMMLGSLFIAPVADKIGRRSIVIFSMTLISIGLLFSAFTTGGTSLMWARLFTGLGIGGSIASFNTMAHEYSSKKRHDLIIGLVVAIGGVSGIAGGVVTSYFITNYDWQAVFIFGGVFSAIITLTQFILLPESVDYLLVRRPEDALERINRLLTKMKYETISVLPEIDTSKVITSSTSMIFSNQYLLKTIFMWISILSMFMGFYFITSWTPKLLVDAGWTIQQSILANIIINAGGVVAGFGFGIISQYIGYRWAIRIVLLLSSGFFVLFGLFGTDWSFRFILPSLLGFFLYGSLIAQYALLPRIYETAIRNTGTGWAAGVGRLGAIAGPYFAGLLLASGWNGFNLYFLYAGCFILSMIAVSVIWMKIDNEQSA